MKVIHVINNLATGGAEKLLTDLIPAMREHQHNVEVLLINDDASTHNIQVLRHAGVPVKILGKPLYSLSAFRLLKTELQNADIVHAHLFPTFYYAALIKLLGAKFKLITTEHSTTNKRAGKFIFRMTDRIMYRFYDHVIAISDDVRHSLIKKGVAKKKVSVISNGTDLLAFKPVADRRPLHRIGMAGRLKHPKNQDVIIRALPLLPEQIKAVFAGAGDRLNELSKLAADLGVAHRVDFIGISNDIPSFYKDIDIHIFASHSEGFGLACIESMAAGVPTVASDIPALSVIVNGHGILFPKDDEKILAGHIRELYDNNGLYRKVADACYLRAQDFSVNQTMEKYLQIYQL
ncbi:glycosyltransferase [Chitinophaga caseinilytica]|uniref:Glycosyltransferase n=1 Tax=Chitinophaga caseinilytica TaxID=2267521 RepID=A0ABZ2Z6M3_9BACT